MRENDFGAGVFLVSAVVVIFFIGMLFAWKNVADDCADFQQFSVVGSIYKCVKVEDEKE